MLVFDLMCPGIGHIIVKRYWSGLAGLIVFIAAAIVFCCETLIPFWRLLQAVLNDSEVFPEQPFNLISIFISFAVMLLDWLFLALDSVYRKL